MKNSSTNKTRRLLAAACLALAPVALAVDPPPDGGYPNQNTAEGEDALFSLTTGSTTRQSVFRRSTATQPAIHNTAIGLCALEQHDWQQQHGQRCSCAL